MSVYKDPERFGEDHMEKGALLRAVDEAFEMDNPAWSETRASVLASFQQPEPVKVPEFRLDESCALEGEALTSALQALAEKGLLLEGSSSSNATHLVLHFADKPGKSMSLYTGVDGLSVAQERPSHVRALTGDAKALRAFASNGLSEQAQELNVKAAFARSEQQTA